MLSHMWGKKLTVLRIHRMGGRWTRHKVASIAQAGLKMANRGSTAVKARTVRKVEEHHWCYILLGELEIGLSVANPLSTLCTLCNDCFRTHVYSSDGIQVSPHSAFLVSGSTGKDHHGQLLCATLVLLVCYRDINQADLGVRIPTSAFPVLE